jgi:hypothetical protein
LIVHPTCPQCQFEGDVEAEFRFGLLDYRTYHLGDTIEWGTKGLRYPRVRPEGGNFEGDGYVECPNCGKDYWVTIKVVNDVISSAEVNVEKPGYIQ